jgi:hypothetical protein
MASIFLPDLAPAGSDLFVDADSVMTELTNEELAINGGGVPSGGGCGCYYPYPFPFPFPFGSFSFSGSGSGSGSSKSKSKSKSKS